MEYRNNYYKIYFWQMLSVLLGFAALFIVVPYISSNQIVYGIFSVCTSLTIFFSYGDMGFLSSGVKYAAEYYIKGAKEEEIRIVGFTSFVMVSVFSVLALGIIVLGIYPKLLIPELIHGSEQMSIARFLLFTLALSCPIIIGQRLVSLIFTIRVEIYKYQKMVIIGNIVRILSVLYFFGDGRYLIVEYYVFYQIVNLFVVMASLLYVHRNYGYIFKDVLAAFHFDRHIFNKVKGLTGASLIITMSSVIYYEIDQVVISNIIGLEAVAVYAAALSALQLVRTFCAIVFSPYPSRYNHFVGLNDYEGLAHFVNKMILLFSPIIIIPILTLSLSAEPFVLSWIGEQYKESAFLISFLVLCFVFNFIIEPISQYFIATERSFILIKYNLLLPLLFWMGVLLLVGLLGSKAFAIMKFVAPISVVISYWVLATKDFRKRGLKFLNFIGLFKVVLPIVAVTIVMFCIFRHWMIEAHTKAALLVNLLIIGASTALCFIITIPFNQELQIELHRSLSCIRNNLVNRKFTKRTNESINSK